MNTQEGICELLEPINFNESIITGYDLKRNLIIYKQSSKKYTTINIDGIFKFLDDNIKSKIKYKIYDDYCQKMILYTYYPDKLNENYKYEKNNIAVKCKSNLNEEYRKLYEKYERIVDILGKFDGLSFGQLPISIVD